MGLTERQGSEPPSDAPRRRNVRGNRMGAALFAAVLLVVALPLLWFAAGHDSHIALAAPLAPTDMPTGTVTATATTTPSPTATPPPATLTIVSPSSRSGPVGAYVTVSGQNFTGSSVALYGTSAPNCGGAQTSLGSAQVNGGSISTTFQWPTSLNANTTYHICAANVTNAPGYQVLSATAPAIQLDATSVEVGKQVTISGTNFLGLAAGSQLTIAVKDAKGAAPTVGNALVADDGTINFPWTATGDPGSYTIQALSAQENGAPPALRASVALTIVAAVSPTAGASPSASPGGTGTGNNNSSNSGLVIALIIGIVLLLLVGLGVVAFLLLRGRGGPPGAGGYGDDGYNTGAYPGYAERNRVPANVPQGATGRQPIAGQYGQSGFYDPQAPLQRPAVGGVAQWDDDPDAATESMDWQPRPMSGYGPQSGQPGYNGYDEGPTNPGAFGGNASYGPADPWASQAGGYGALPPLNPDDSWGDGATQAVDPGQPPRPQTPPRRGAPPADPFSPRGPGDTNPDPRGGW